MIAEGLTRRNGSIEAFCSTSSAVSLYMARYTYCTCNELSVSTLNSVSCLRLLLEYRMFKVATSKNLPPILVSVSLLYSRGLRVVGDG